MLHQEPADGPDARQTGYRRRAFTLGDGHACAMCADEPMRGFALQPGCAHQRGNRVVRNDPGPVATDLIRRGISAVIPDPDFGPDAPAGHSKCV